MRIAFIYDVIYPFVKGGVEKRIWELSVRLARQGNDVHIFGMKYWEGEDTFSKNGVTIHGICPSRDLYADGRRTSGEAMYFGLRLLMPLLKEKRFDIIDCQNFPFFPALTARIVSLVRRTRLVITWHEVWGEYWNEYLGRTGGPAGVLVERVVALLCCPVIAVSGHTAVRFQEQFHKPVSAIIPNGIDTRALAVIPPSPLRSDLIFAGRLIKEKHVDVLIRAYHLLLRDRPELTLTLIGDGPEGAPIRSFIDELGLGGRVKFCGFVEDPDKIIALMKSAHVFVVPSTREGFGMAALEALACGLPVVTVDHPANAIREFIRHDTGFLCALSPESLAGVIPVALDRCEAMRPACRTSAEAYDWNQIVDRLEQFYGSVLL